MRSIMTFNEAKVTESSDSFYVIVVTLSNLGHDSHAFFKTDRYSCYSERPRTTYDESNARHYKTAEGAHEALKKLQAKGTIKPAHKGIVCRYLKTVTTMVRFDIVPVTVEALVPVGN
jgi:hypothetical protein